MRIFISILLMNITICAYSLTYALQQTINQNDLKALRKEFKKNPEKLTTIGNTLLKEGHLVEAREFAILANKKAKNYAPAYLLLGDIELANNNTSDAFVLYNKIIDIAPNDSSGYYRIQDIEGKNFYSSLEYKKAIDSWKVIPTTKMSLFTIIDYATANYYLGNHADGFRIANQGINLYPNDIELKRIAMRCATELEEYTEARQLQQQLLKIKNSTELSYLDYYYSGLIYDGLNLYDKAISYYHKVLESKVDSNIIQKTVTLAKLSNDYVKINDLKNAIIYYKLYISSKDEVTDNDYTNLANLHLKYSDTIDNQKEKEENLIEADSIYKIIANNNELVAYMRANINSKLDPDSQKGLAKPYFEELIKIIESKHEKNEEDLNKLITAYHYLMTYSFLQENDKKRAKEYSSKILEIQPDFSPAIQIKKIK